MILVSVDDHVVEPPTLFDDHLPDKWKDAAPKSVHSDGIDVWEFEGNVIPNIGLNAVAGRPPEEYNIEPTSYDMIRSGLLRHPRARQGHEPQRSARLDVLPELRPVLRAAVQQVEGSRHVDPPAPRVQRLAHRRVVRHLPRPLHAAVHPADLGPPADGRRGPARRQEGVPHGHVLGESVQARLAPHLRRPLGSVLRRV